MQDYIQLAMRTCSPHGDQLLHSAIGMMTEAVEVEHAEDEANFLEEMGDVLWYVAIGCDALGVTLEQAEGNAIGTNDGPVELAARYLAEMKKQIFYGKPVVPLVMTGLLGGMIALMRELCEDSEITLEEVMAQNIAKLQKRFPDRFTEDLAINRKG